MCNRLCAMSLTILLLGCGWDRTGLAADKLLPTSGSSSSEQFRSQSPPAPPTEPVQTVSLPERTPGGQTLATVMARVNGQPILREEVLNSASWRLEELRPRVPPAKWAEVEAEIIKSELEQIIDRELLLQDASSRVRPKVMEKVADSASREFDGLLKKQKSQLNLKSDEELRAYLEKRGNSIEEMRRQHIRAYTAMEYIRSLIRDKLDQISREDLLDYYRENPKEFDKPERVTWQHIFVDRYIFSSEEEARAQAQMVHARARNMTTEQFAELAEDPNINRSPSRLRKGEGEGNERGQIRPADVEEALFKLNSGEVGPLIETPTGYHIIRVIDHVPGGKIPFERACPDIRRRLQNKIGQIEYKRVVEELRAKAHIENSLAK